MFHHSHLIWKWADYWDELDDWLPAAEDLVHRWNSQAPEQIQFQTQFELRVACLLLHDHLLPYSALKTLSKLVLETMVEARAKAYRLDHLHVVPDKPGRKKDTSRFMRMWELEELLTAGTPKMKAYKQIADKYNKSPDTIRRDYERKQKASN